MPAQPLDVLDTKATVGQIPFGNSTMWKRIGEGEFPGPINPGSSRACWLQIQITDYLYQITRYGDWCSVRAADALDRVYANALGDRAASNAMDQHENG